jgi:uncharacterized protein YbaP (TraB family)
MKKIIFALLLSVTVITITAKAQESALLWKIEHEKLENPSYLFGTIHLICQEDMIDFPAIDSVFAQVDQVVFELDFSDPELAQKMMRHSQNSVENHIENYLNDNQMEAVNNYLSQHFGVGLSQLGNLKPFVIMSMVMQAMLECTTQSFSYDGFLFQKAQGHSLHVSGLETPEFQFSVMDKIPDEEYVKGLKEIIEDPDSHNSLFGEIVDYYLDQDIESLYLGFLESSFGVYQQDILDRRNKAWISDMPSIMENSPVLFAVGAGHLAGENGVIELLRQQGYSVTAVSNDLKSN